MYNNTKIYKDRGGKRQVVDSGGEMLIRAGAKLTIEGGAEVDGVLTPQAAYMGELGTDVSSIALLRAEVNQLLERLKDAGLMADTLTIEVAVLPDTLELIAGAIDSGDVLTADAVVSDGSTPVYQWYSNATASNEGGSAISGATGASYAIPTETAAGTYHYYCVATYEDVSQASNVATVTVASAG